MMGRILILLCLAYVCSATYKIPRCGYQPSCSRTEFCFVGRSCACRLGYDRKYGKCVKSAKRVELKKLGCWKDTRDRAIQPLEGKYGLIGNYRERADALQACAKVVKGLTGHYVFALQHGGWCASAPTAGMTYKKYGPSNHCERDGEGGPWANEVYKLVYPDEPCGGSCDYGKVCQNGKCVCKSPLVYDKASGKCVTPVPCGGKCNPKTQTCKNNKCVCNPGLVFDKSGRNCVLKLKNLGCWKDTRSRAIAPLEGKYGLDGQYQRREDAIQACARVAKKLGYSVFAIQHGGWCASAKNAEQTYRKYGPSKHCQKDGKGGPWANQVYRIIDSREPCGGDCDRHTQSCKDEECVCKPGYVFNLPKWPCERPCGGKCDRHTQTCQNNKCVCNKGLVPDKGGRKCVTKCAVVKCDDDTEKCVDGKCVCVDGLIRKGNKCVCKDPRKEYNRCSTNCPRTCDNRFEDVIRCNKACRPVNCVCRHGYVERSKHNTDCVREYECPPHY